MAAARQQPSRSLQCRSIWVVSALARPGGSGRDCRSTADARGLRTMAFEVASSCSSQLVLVLCVLAHSAGSDGGGSGSSSSISSC